MKVRDKRDSCVPSLLLFNVVPEATAGDKRKVAEV